MRGNDVNFLIRSPAECDIINQLELHENYFLLSPSLLSGPGLISVADRSTEESAFISVPVTPLELRGWRGTQNWKLELSFTDRHHLRSA